MISNPIQILVGLFLFVPICLRAEVNLKDTSQFEEGEAGALSTGSEERAELERGGGRFRLGTDSKIKIREGEAQILDLEKGVLLVECKKQGLFRGREEVTVETPQIQMKARAKVLLSYQPGRYVKLACIEGTAEVSLKSFSNETVTISKGEMLVVHCLENVLPPAISVDMNRLVATSPLLRPDLRSGIVSQRSPAVQTAARSGREVQVSPQNDRVPERQVNLTPERPVQQSRTTQSRSQSGSFQQSNRSSGNSSNRTSNNRDQGGNNNQNNRNNSSRNNSNNSSRNNSNQNSNNSSSSNSNSNRSR